MLKFRNLEGYYARTDGFGRLFFDKCATDEEHLLNREIPPDEDRPRCRIYAEDLLPTGSLGIKANWKFNILAEDPNEPPTT